MGQDTGGVGLLVSAGRVPKGFHVHCVQHGSGDRRGDHEVEKSPGMRV